MKTLYQGIAGTCIMTTYLAYLVTCVPVFGVKVICETWLGLDEK